MIATLITFLANIIIQVISSIGYAGIYLLMLLESCGFLIPSEIIMPFSGFLVATGKLNFWLVIFLGTLGNLSGSLLAYWISIKGGRPLVEKFGKYILISKHDLDVADNWFKKRGKLTVFIGRCLPIVRTYISFPAGVAKMNVFQFSFYTFIGAALWSILFTWLGVKLQNNWELINVKLHEFNLIIAILVVLFIALYIWRHIKHNKS
ncbi:MAG: DedA family protein [Patescibacteria group bacterium]|nr:DedA family protein [Patescibacteria group bacterium]MDD5121518.1 DedA family protein [Patescibacteria group bacterium]MDD5221848.1 DedA family protein [Patescibacteria group bacterium]MDD5396319.1 DedA family protein [Patescibacteria group bacterium]